MPRAACGIVAFTEGWLSGLKHCIAWYPHLVRYTGDRIGGSNPSPLRQFLWRAASEWLLDLRWRMF